MSSVDIGRAQQTLASQAFLMSAAMVVGGSVAAALLTRTARDEIYDVEMKGGDAIYAFITAFALLAVVPQRKFAKPLALGAASSGVVTIFREMGLLDMTV